MRTLSEIIDSAKDGNKPSHDECYWAMLALSALHHFDHRALMELPDKTNAQLAFRLNWEREETFRRSKAAYAKSPQEYVGWNNDPANPEYQRERQVALRLFKKFEIKE